METRLKVRGPVNGIRPSEDFSWATYATKHSISDTHVDTDGLGTCSQPLVGSKLWILFQPKHPQELHNPGRLVHFDDIDEGMSAKLDDHWVFAYLLSPGMVL